ncbi:MAG: DegT/DnrJ/EryC1/StrS family aminotransferase, partial [Lachnospiraceae bacterium]|nr:DegT/DnrJ/EryC1/StrS family aminotransferase [Lachnospiraceae bacterium]
YNEGLRELADEGRIELPFVPGECTHNAHMFYIKLADVAERTRFIEYMKKNEVWTVFHYIPLHSAPAGRKYGRFNGEDRYTTKESERLVRLPMYYGLSEKEADMIVELVRSFYGKGY